jgi:hypothetical protein
MSIMGTEFGPGLLHCGQLYWNNLMGMKRVNTSQKERGVKDKAKHIMYIPWCSGKRK